MKNAAVKEAVMKGPVKLKGGGGDEGAAAKEAKGAPKAKEEEAMKEAAAMKEAVLESAVRWQRWSRRRCSRHR